MIIGEKGKHNPFQLAVIKTYQDLQLLSRTVIISNKFQCTKVRADYVEVLENKAGDYRHFNNFLVPLIGGNQDSHR